MRTFKIISVIIVIILCLYIMPSFAQTATVKGDEVNIRKEANTSSDVVTTIPQNTEVEILGKEDNWYKVEVNSKTGYIREDLLNVQDETVANVTTDNTTDVMDDNITDETTETATTTKQIKVHLVPLINSTVISTINTTTEVKVIETLNGWQYVELEKISGWVRKADLEKKDEVQEEITEPIESEISTVEQEQQEEVARIENELEKPEETEEIITTEQSTTKIAYICKDDVNVRKEPSTNADVLKLVELNTQVEIIEKLSGWYKIKVNGTVGYVADWLVSDTKVTTNRNLETPRVSGTSSTVVNPNGESIVEYAKQFLGCPYVYGSSGPNSFDCSGFTMYVFKQYGYSISHSATAQSKLGEYVDYDNLKPGDLVFFKDYQTMEGIGHCGIYIGGGDFIHASSGTGYCVKISTLLSGSYLNRYATARRII